jgi:hypothetical protein
MVCWLNGNFQQFKIKNLSAGKTYFPYVDVSSNGNQIILNPYAVHPKHKLALFEPVQLKLLEK